MAAAIFIIWFDVGDQLKELYAFGASLAIELYVLAIANGSLLRNLHRSEENFGWVIGIGVYVAMKAMLFIFVALRYGLHRR